MPTYALNHAYESYRDGTRYGPWAAGELVDLDQADAAWVERDSPGALTAAAGDQPAVPVPALGARPRVNGDPDNADVAAVAQERVHAEARARQAVDEPVAEPAAEEPAEEVSEVDADDEDEPAAEKPSGKKPARNRQHSSGAKR